MSQRNGDVRRFKVIYSQEARKNIRGFVEQAKEEGRGPLVAAVFRKIDRHLHERADEFGDQLQPPLNKGKSRVASIRPLVVYFSVMDDSPIVFVTAVRMMSIGAD